MKMHQQAILENKKVIKVDVNTYFKWLEKAVKDFEKYYRVKSTYLKENSIHVSTVFLGINHGYEKLDLWFETMVFGIKNEIQERYTTWEEAESGHDKVVQEVLELLKK